MGVGGGLQSVYRMDRRDKSEIYRSLKIMTYCYHTIYLTLIMSRRNSAVGLTALSTRDCKSLSCDITRSVYKVKQ